MFPSRSAAVLLGLPFLVMAAKGIQVIAKPFEIDDRSPLMVTALGRRSAARKATTLP